MVGKLAIEYMYAERVCGAGRASVGRQGLSRNMCAVGSYLLHCLMQLLHCTSELVDCGLLECALCQIDRVSAAGMARVWATCGLGRDKYLIFRRAKCRHETKNASRVQYSWHA